MRRIRRALPAAAVVIAAGCGGHSGGDPRLSATIDRPGLAGCDVFARGILGAVNAEARAALAEDTQAAVAGSTAAGLVSGAAGLVRTARRNDSAWTLAADTFAAACMDDGWTAPR